MGKAWIRSKLGQAGEGAEDGSSAASLSISRNKLTAQIDSLVKASHVLQTEDFDARVHEMVSAINLSGGPAMVCAALLSVQEATSKKVRPDVRNWPAYIATLLGRFVEGAAVPVQADVVQFSKQLSWVLRRGARQSGVWINPGGWVRLQDLIKCRYFAEYTEGEMIAIANESNASKARYEMRITERGENEIRAVRAGEDRETPRGSSHAGSSSHVDSGGYSGRGTPTQYREPGTPTSFQGPLRSLQTVDHASEQLGSPAMERTPQTHGGYHAIADFTPEAKKSHAAARHHSPEPGLFKSGKPSSASSSSGQRTTQAVSESFGASVLKGSRDPGSVSAVLRVAVSSLNQGRSEGLSNADLERLARESLLDSGFRPRDVLSVEVDGTRTSCFVQVLLIGDTEVATPPRPKPVVEAVALLPR